MTTAPTKNPAELMADLTDQVRLLRLDVTNLTATAVSQDEAAELRTHLHQTLRETNANALKILREPRRWLTKPAPKASKPPQTPHNGP